MRRIEKITGRCDDMMIIRGVNVFPTQIEELILQIAGLSPHYYCEISRPDRLDVLSVFVEAKAGTSDDLKDKAAKDLQSRIKTLIGVSTLINVRPANSLDRSHGKAKRIIDRREEKA